MSQWFPSNVSGICASTQKWFQLNFSYIRQTMDVPMRLLASKLQTLPSRSPIVLAALLGSLWTSALAAERSVAAVFTEEGIILDGVLQEGAWPKAQPATGFIQSEPRPGQLASQPTEVRILFDEDNLYLGVSCLDDNPQGPVVKSLRVDFSSSDEDSFEILLDPFASGRDGFLFIVNPSGAKRDEQISNGGREVNASWDAVWDVKTRVTPAGWTAEIRIPFKTLRYPKGAGRPWRINFGRHIRRHNESTYWSPLPRQFDIRQVHLSGMLEGLSAEKIRPGRNVQVTPYVVSSAIQNNGDTSTKGDVGGDIKYGLTSGLTLDLTVNTDFSHVEVDQQQVNLDRFRLSFPEKRDFFLENSGVFEIGSVRLSAGLPDPEDALVFYSRNVGLSPEGQPVPILGGGRLSGRMGQYSLGLMSIQTDRMGSQEAENATVLRAKRDLLERSYVGGFYLSRTGSERAANRLYGFDGLYQPRRDLTFSGHFAKSQTPGVRGDDWMFRTEALYDASWLTFRNKFTEIQDDFRNDLGFTLRHGVWIERLEVRPRLRPPRRGIIREIQPYVSMRFVAGPRAGMVYRQHSLGFDVPFQNGAFLRIRRRNFFERLEENFRIRSGITIPTGDYHFNDYGVEFTSDRSRALSGNARWYDGDFWNGEKASWQLGGRFEPNAHLSTEVSYSRDRVRLRAGAFTTSLSRFRIQYSFNTVTSLDALVQYNLEDQSVTSNVRFNWIHRPLSDLFLVYTEERPTSGAAPVNRVFTLKYTYLISF